VGRVEASLAVRHLALGLALFAAAFVTSGCRDYALLTQGGDLSASVDLGDQDLTGRDLTDPPDGADLAGDGAVAPVVDAAMCPAAPSPPDFGLGFPAITTENQATLGVSTTKPKQVVVGHFVSATELDVVTLTPGAAGAAELHFLRSNGGASLQYVTGGVMPFCASQIVAGHVVSATLGQLDQLVLSCDCGVYTTETCAVRSYEWSSAGAATPGMPTLVTILDLGTVRPLAIALARLAPGDARDSLIVAEKGSTSGNIATYAIGPLGKFMTASVQLSPNLPAADTSAIATGSFNSATDSTIDVAALSAAGTSPVLTIITRSATGVMTIASGTPALPAINVTGMAVGDLDQDTLADLLFTTVSGDSASLFLQSKLSPSFFNVTTLPMGGLSYAPTLVDWNRDGALDIFFWRQGDGGGTNLSAVHPRLLWNHGSLNFESVAAPGALDRSSFVVIPGYLLAPQGVAADVDDNCTPELVFVEGQSSRVSVFRR